MRLLALPNWSFGRDKRMLASFREALDSPELSVHFCRSDVDHNRTVTAFSGEPTALKSAVLELADLCFDSIDLNRHTGVHPRVGALDVCPVIQIPSESDDESLNAALALAEDMAKELSDRYDLPVIMFEKSERNRAESEIHAMIEGGYGGLLDRELKPDYGPSRVHSRLGMSLVGVKQFFITFGVDLKLDSAVLVKELVVQVHDLRMAGDPRFLGVSALGLPLPSRGRCQLLFTLSLPDITSVDGLVEWVAFEASRSEVMVADTELIGVIRERDLAGATRLAVRAEQLV